MSDLPNILIVGAGPAGLSCALGLLRSGCQVTIIDKRPNQRTFSKATGVSLASIRILIKLGLSASIVDKMIPMRRFIFYDNTRLISDLKIPFVNSEPPAWLFPQNTLEQLLEAELNKQGCYVQYDTAIESIITMPSITEVVLGSAKSASRKEHYQWLIGADGAHSRVRQLCHFDFKGKVYPETWSVAEVKTSLWKEDVQAELFLGAEGNGLFISYFSKGHVQGILNHEKVADKLRKKFPDAQVIYERNFQVSLKKVASPRKGRVWLIGDAAHVQSPVGGQGLNLAISDAYILSKWLIRDVVQAEKKLARNAKITLFFTDFDYKMLSTRSKLLRTVRNYYWACAAQYPRLSQWFFKIISGIHVIDDH